MYFVEALLEEKFEDTKGVIRSRKSQDRPYSGQDIKVIRNRKSQDRQYSGQDTKGVIRSRKSQDRQYSIVTALHYCQQYF